MLVQKKKIEIDKWCEGCATNNDPGQDYVLDWINRNGSWFRKAWERSLCKNCVFIDECGIDLKSCCEKFSAKIKNVS